MYETCGFDQLRFRLREIEVDMAFSVQAFVYRLWLEVSDLCSDLLISHERG